MMDVQVGTIWVSGKSKKVRVVEVEEGVTFVEERDSHDFNGCTMENLSFLEFQSFYSPA